MTRADIEMLWVDAWNDLYDIIEQDDNFPCILPDFICVSAPECQGWLQQSVYDGFNVSVSRGWHEGRPAAIVSRQPRLAGQHDPLSH